MSQQPEINYPENINLEFPEGKVEQDKETNPPYQEEIFEQEYNRPTEKHYKESLELKKKQVNMSKCIYNLLQKQTVLNKILKLRERKILKGIHLPMSMKAIHTGYLTSPFFKNIYLYLAQRNDVLLGLQ